MSISIPWGTVIGLLIVAGISALVGVIVRAHSTLHKVAINVETILTNHLPHIDSRLKDNTDAIDGLRKHFVSHLENHSKES